MTQGLKLFTGICAKIIAFAAAIGLIVRTVLAAITPAPLEFGFGQWIAMYGLGAVNDICIATVSLIFMWLYTVSLTNAKYSRPIGYTILSLLVAAVIYVTCFNTPFHEYGSVVPLIARIIFGFWAAGFALRFFVPAVRRPWSRTWFWFLASAYVLGIYFNAVGEYFFWDEFNVRYNFIAVDYLIYTNEVVGNIMESYAIVPIFSVVLLLTAATSWLLFRADARRLDSLLTTRWKAIGSAAWLMAAAAGLSLAVFNTRFQQTDNVYFNELQSNGAYRFIDAFRKNHLDYTQFYTTMPLAEAEARINAIYGSTGQNFRHVAPDSTALLPAGSRPNIVLVTLESMSASFMQRYGSTRDITPNLDSLAAKSLSFDNLIATGNRTVRGLEALTLSLPPCPGESIIKRPECAGMQSSVGTMLGSLGYRPIYFYGGNSYFDNMGTFFSGNGYEVVDAAAYKPQDITFKNIWGVSDEDSYHKALSVIDTIAPQGPFFAHIMSISNHRPYTYPEGRIPIPTDSKKRAGGVMYSDWALGEFIDLASQQPWFANTIFVIVADHCASSAGKTELPLEKYHIPAMIYAPGLIQPQAVDKFCSQIDLLPTLFALIGLEYDTYAFGRNILAPDYHERAFLATYENLGYLDGDILTVLSPVRRIEQFRVTPTADNPYNTEPVETVDTALVNRAVAYYQTSSQWYSPE